jgi:hypothetical protein
VTRMGDDTNTNITERLKKLVQNRKTPIIENKRIIGYRPHKSTSGSASAESYSYSLDE